MIGPVRISATAVVGSAPLVPDDLARQLRRADDFITLAAVAARQVLESGPARDLSPGQTGIFIGTAYGPLETNFSSLGSLIDDGEGQISPTLFSHSVFNAAAGYVARLMNIQGPAATVTTYGWPWLAALQEAWLAVVSGRVDRALVLGVEVYSDLLRDALCRVPGRDGARQSLAMEPGAVAWLLDPTAADGLVLNGVTIIETPTEPDLLLSRANEAWSGPGLPEHGNPTPLAHGQAMTEALASSLGRELVWQFTAPFGRAEVVIAPA